MITTRRKTALTGGVLALTMLLTSCIKVDMDIELDDGTASGSMVLAVSQEMMDLAGGDTSDFFEDTDVPEGATVEPYEDDDFVGQRYTFDDVTLSEFSDPEFSITYDEAAGRYEVDGAMDFTGDAGEIPPEMESIVEAFDVTVSITFPGEVTEHNGELDGNTVTWQPRFGETTELHAIAEEGSGVPAWLWGALAVLALLLAVGLLALLLRRRSGGEGTSVDTPGYTRPTGGQGAALGDVTRDLPPATGDAIRGGTPEHPTRDLSGAAGGTSRNVTRDLSDDLPARGAEPDESSTATGSGGDTR